MDRRQFLTTSSAVTAGLALTAKPSIAAPTTTAAATPGDAKLNALLEEIFQDRVRRNPTFATSLGLDKGPLAHLKSEMDTRPPAKARGEDLALAKATLAKVEVVNPADSLLFGQDQPRRRHLPAKSGMIAPEKFGHRQRDPPLSDLPAGRRLFLGARFPQHQPHDRNRRRRRSLSVAARAGRHRCSTRTARCSRPRLRAASCARTGRST